MEAPVAKNEYYDVVFEDLRRKRWGACFLGVFLFHKNLHEKNYKKV